MGFPKKFLWGAATAAHQVEGGLHNQWSVWEHRNAQALADTALKRIGGYESWPRFKRSASMPQNYLSELAADHFTLYEQDFDLLEKLNLNAYRFSVEWSRIEPEEGVWNEIAFAHYRDYLSSLKKRGIEPVMTLFHFTLPVWFAEKGGFEKARNVRYFVRFARKVMKELGEHVTYVITINEPEVYGTMSYLTGWWPPTKKNIVTTIRVVNNLISAHNRTARMIHRLEGKHQVSLAKHSLQMHPATDRRIDRLSAKILQYINDGYILNRVVKTCDFLGVNYYQSFWVRGLRFEPPTQAVNDLNWQMVPGDIQNVLERLDARYNLPIMITENGVADAEDQYRQDWLQDTIAAMELAQEHGVMLLGYMHWSLLDNFEWSFGRWPRFGLVHVDYDTHKRTIRPSAEWYAKRVKHERGV